jgi:murein DD-endopeptidase MepM/ murein hydrolase activator NlpD
MRRAIARWMGWWLRLFILSVILFRFTAFPPRVELLAAVLLLLLAFVRPRGAPGRAPEVVAPPVRGRWTALNSPATKVPSHGVRAYGQTYAIDILHPRPPGAPATIGWGIGMRRPERFPTFGEPVLAVADGVVVRASGWQRDHRSRESWPALAVMMTIEGAVRETVWAGLVLGNHVVVDHGDGVYAAYAHLRRRSLLVAEGDRVQAGQQLAEVGNSGNTTEPHLHVQLMDRPVLTAAAGVPFRWRDIEIVPGAIDPSYAHGPVSTVIEPGLPADGQVFVAAAEDEPSPTPTTA